MSLSIGIVGLPNVGKSTLFNALLKKQAAYAANFPFATIEPNVGVVPVPDGRLSQLQAVISKQSGIVPPIVQATVKFVDIAGLIAGAHKGEGLGNKFLSHIREVDVICHVVRAFADPDVVRAGSTDPKSDFEVVEAELILADLQTVDNQLPRLRKSDTAPKFRSAVEKIKADLEKGIPARKITLDEHEVLEAKQLSLLTSKPILIVLNADESDINTESMNKIIETKSVELGIDPDQLCVISAKVEEDLSALTDEEQKEYLKELGATESGLEKLIRTAFYTLGLITFLTAGEKEVRAWTIKKESTAPVAAGAIHTDFEKKFIKADVAALQDFIAGTGWKGAREVGKVRSEGRDYIVKDGDVIEFKIGS